MDVPRLVFLSRFAARFSMSVLPGFLAVGFWGALLDTSCSLFAVEFDQLMLSDSSGRVRIPATRSSIESVAMAMVWSPTP